MFRVTCFVGSSRFVSVAWKPGEVKIRSQFVVHEIRAGHSLRSLAGWAGHVFVTEEGRTRIARKTVGLVDADRTHGNLTFLL